MAKKPKENPENRRIVLTLASKLGVDLKNLRHAVTTNEFGARVEQYDGSLRATLFPDDAGVMEIEGKRLPGLKISIVDRNNPKHCTAPEGAVYEIFTYNLEGNDDTNPKVISPGVMYVDSEGRFVTNSNVAENILKRSNYKMIGERR